MTKFFLISDYQKMREKSVSNPHLSYYAIFLFFLIVVVEFMPMVLAIANLSFLYRTPVMVSPLERPVLKQATSKKIVSHEKVVRKIDFDSDYRIDSDIRQAKGARESLLSDHME